MTFSQEHPSSVHTESIYTSLPTMLRGRACSVRARQTRAREDGRWRRDPLTPASLQLPSLLVRSIEFCQALTRQTAKELLTIESKTDIVIHYMLIHAYMLTCLDMAQWKPAFRGVNVKKIHMWKNDTSNRTLFFTWRKIIRRIEGTVAHKFRANFPAFYRGACSALTSWFASQSF